ncbi:hypothetical protein ILUMI_24626 [Ignelater luminosus]|uniref:MAGE domain-containing protein n=1 Tax=Ignelater luminosus TaxID=2038154 RepID=A0A8K0FWI5_IGNLU|nr:hypothetical protein ILUMI_24626 [Ignelater luminosus]
MPRKTQLSQKTPSKISASTSKQNVKNQSSTQMPLEQSFSKSQKTVENVEELVNNCVRYVLYRAGNNLPIRKPDLQKNVLQHVGRSFDQILDKVTQILKNVYGYDLYLSDDTSSTKQYLVSTALPYKPDLVGFNTNANEDQNAVPPDVNKILILLVLTHIFMSNNNINEASLFAFLRSVKIDPDEKHELFGNVKDFMSTMVKQKYLSTEVDEITRRTIYSWGPRAEHEISKHEILKFVCKMYKDRLPKSWTTQYEQANAQAKGDDEVVEVEAREER